MGQDAREEHVFGKGGNRWQEIIDAMILSNEMLANMLDDGITIDRYSEYLLLAEEMKHRELLKMIGGSLNF